MRKITSLLYTSKTEEKGSVSMEELVGNPQHMVFLAENDGLRDKQLDTKVRDWEKRLDFLLNKQR